MHHDSFSLPRHTKVAFQSEQIGTGHTAPRRHRARKHAIAARANCRERRESKRQWEFMALWPPAGGSHETLLASIPSSPARRRLDRRHGDLARRDFDDGQRHSLAAGRNAARPARSGRTAGPLAGGSGHRAGRRQLRSKSDYSGETWNVDFSPTSSTARRARTESSKFVSNAAATAQPTRVTVEARYPDDPRRRAKVERVWKFPIQNTNSPASDTRQEIVP